MTFILPLSLIIILLATQIIKRSFLEKNLRKIFWIPILAIFSFSTILSVMQYKAWQGNELMRFALEAEGGINGFLYNAFANHFAPYVLSLLLALIFMFLMHRLNRRAEGRFFEKEEILIAFLSAFLSGFPGFLLFILGVLVAYLIAHIINKIIKRNAGSNVVPLYYFWLPVASFVIITEMVWLSKLEFWSLLSI
jgi:hypothetical protein